MQSGSVDVAGLQIPQQGNGLSEEQELLGLKVAEAIIDLNLHLR